MCEQDKAWLTSISWGMKSKLALQFPPQPIDGTILLGRGSICGSQRFRFVHLAV